MGYNKWSKRGYGCAFAGDSFLALGIRYNSEERRIRIEYAWDGDVADKRSVAALARHLHRKPFWTSVKFASQPEYSDVKVRKVDVGDNKNKLRGKNLKTAIKTQLKYSLVHSQENYIFMDYALKKEAEADSGETIGAFAPRKSVDATVDMWKKLGLIKIRVGSRIAGLTNLFVALHPVALGDQPVHRLIAFQNCHARYFCYLKKRSLIDSGITTDEVLQETADFRKIIANVQAWGREFTHAHEIPNDNSVMAYLLAESEDVYHNISFEKFPLVSLWTVPWGDSIDFASEAVEETVKNSQQTAVMALGMALHGV